MTSIDTLQIDIEEILTSQLPRSTDICAFLGEEGKESMVPPYIAAYSANELASRFSNVCSCLGVVAKTVLASAPYTTTNLPPFSAEIQRTVEDTMAQDKDAGSASLEFLDL